MKFHLAFLSVTLCHIALPAQAQPAAPLRVVLADVTFAANKSAIGPEAGYVLDAVAHLLRATPAATLEVGVHTDASGSTSYNLRLSKRRAEAIGAYLTKKGVAAKRLKTKGYGESKPINRCRRGVRCTEAENRENRRVELRVQGLPADSSARVPWLALGEGTFLLTPKPVKNPSVPTVAETPVPNGNEISPGETGGPVPAPTAGKQTVPRPLPPTFTGYTVEIACTEKPLAPDSPPFRKHEAVFLRQEPGGPYCYFVGAFFTLPEARQYLLEKIRPEAPWARVACFTQKDTKQYFDH
ncbi:MAG: OmpA family protein [Saprospiraceae bacterium]